MTVLLIILAAGAMLILAVLMSFILGWANKTFHVPEDPKLTQVKEALPGANCGGCGYAGCDEYAEAVVAGQAPPDLCSVGGASCAQAIASILGLEVEKSWPYRAVVHCNATWDDRRQRNPYEGEQTCAAANLVAGVQGCTYGCLGLGDCVTACKFDAIHIVDGLATVDYDACVGCKACAAACPRNIISMVPFKAEQMVVIKCSNQDFGKDVKAVCKVGCIGCKACARFSELIEMADNLPQINYDDYDPDKLTEALEKCPMKSLVYVGTPSEKDLAAVADEELPDVVQADFKTTVDDTEWRG